MNFKKLAIGFVIALSVAFALDFVSKTTLQNKAIESDAERQILLFADRNKNWELILNSHITERPNLG